MSEKRKKKISKTPTRVDYRVEIVNCQFVPDGILSNLLMTLIDLVS